MTLDQTDSEDWSIHEAIAVSFDTFARRFGADLLWAAFQALTGDRETTLAEHVEWEKDIDKFIQYPLSMSGANLLVWMTNARADDYSTRMLCHMGIRWWLARDDLLSRPPKSRVPCVYTEGLSNHVNLQLLNQMLYRGRAPYTTCD